MSYLHINNLYNDERILAFRSLYATEKVHGTSAHVRYRSGEITYFSGGCSREIFIGLFFESTLLALFTALGHADVTVYGEQYGGKQQGMSATYGKDARFIVFEVQVGKTWLAVPNAADVAAKLGLEYVPYRVVEATLEALNAERDRDSEVAVNCGMGLGHPREGIVLRPPFECCYSDGSRVIAKHKRDDFRETATPRRVGDKTTTIAGDAAALEWVTDMRLTHVMDAVRAQTGRSLTMADTSAIVSAMIADVEREGTGEVVVDKATRKALGSRAAKMFIRTVKI